MTTREPPVCKRCCDSPGSIKKLQQHSDISKRPKKHVKPPRHLLEGSLGHISLERPFSRDANFVTDDPLKTPSSLRPPPAWISLLPPQKNPNVHQPKHFMFQCRSTFPYFESTRMTTPNESQEHTPHNKIPMSTITAQLKIGLSLPGSPKRSEIPSSNQSFVSFVENQEVTADHYRSYVPERPLCPSVNVVQPSINFSRPRQPLAAKSAASVINETEKVARAQRARRRLTSESRRKSPLKSF
jgi:hypothetical protein